MNILPTAMVMTITAAVFAWAFYRLIYQGLSEILIEFGIVGDVWQNIIIIVFAGVILIAGGRKLGDLIK